jgi:purine-binding chemotaxis protein CheW
VNRSVNRPGIVLDWEALKKRAASPLQTALSAGELERVYAERAAALAQGTTLEVQSRGLDLFAFVHAGIRLALDTTSVVRILRPRPLTAVPGAPPHLSHVFYEAGRIVSIADVSLLLGRGNCPHDGARIVLLEGSGFWLGICTESVLGPLRCDAARLGAPSPNLDARIARSVRGVADDMTVVLDGVALVDTLKD